MNFNLEGKTILVTGGSRGIGRASVLLLAGSGARIIFQYAENNKAAKQILEELNKFSPGHLAIKCDFKTPDSLDSFTDEVLSKVERVDVLVNNAGIYLEKPFKDISFTEWKSIWDQTISVNLTSVANLSFLLSKHMIEKGGGKIINVSSRGAFRGEPDAPAYGASKAGLNSLGQSMAKALGPYNIFVYTLAPGFVETDMAKDALLRSGSDSIIRQSPLNRVASPDEIARMIAFLSDDGCEYLTGCIIDINGASYLRS